MSWRGSLLLSRGLRSGHDTSGRRRSVASLSVSRNLRRHRWGRFGRTLWALPHVAQRGQRPDPRPTHEAGTYGSGYTASAGASDAPKDVVEFRDLAPDRYGGAARLSPPCGPVVTASLSHRQVNREVEPPAATGCCTSAPCGSNQRCAAGPFTARRAVAKAVGARLRCCICAKGGISAGAASFLCCGRGQQWCDSGGPLLLICAREHRGAVAGRRSQQRVGPRGL